LRLLASLWALPVTLLGLLLAALLGLSAGLRWQWRAGVLELLPRREPRWLRRLNIDAIALGELVIARNAALMQSLRSHERVHVAQARRWGPLFLLAYPLASLICWLRGQQPYWDNRFEREARAGALATPEQPDDGQQQRRAQE
jgi:hypothetical protein